MVSLSSQLLFICSRNVCLWTYGPLIAAQGPLLDKYRIQRGRSVSIVTRITGWMTGVLFSTGAGLLATASSPALGLTQPPMKRVAVLFRWG